MRGIYIFLIILVILIIGGGVWYFSFYEKKAPSTTDKSSMTSKGEEKWIKNETVLFENVTSSDTHRLDDGTFRMYFQKDGKIVYADSGDAATFSAPVSTGIDENSGKMISNPSVLQIKEGDWIMVYEEQPIQQPDSKQPPGPETQRNLLLATSSDGKSFSKAGIAIDSAKEDNYFASVPDLVKTPDNKIRMYYVCGGEDICSAISSDGKSWTKEEGIRLSGHVDPDVSSSLECLDCKKPNKWVMYCATLSGGGNKFYKATSEDGLKWVKGEVILQPETEKGAVVDPDVVEISSGKWRMFFGEMAEGEGQMGGPAQINLYFADFTGNIFNDD
jgi:hypothetical protein